MYDVRVLHPTLLQAGLRLGIERWPSRTRNSARNFLLALEVGAGDYAKLSLSRCCYARRPGKPRVRLWGLSVRRDAKRTCPRLAPPPPAPLQEYCSQYMPREEVAAVLRCAHSRLAPYLNAFTGWRLPATVLPCLGCMHGGAMRTPLEPPCARRHAGPTGTAASQGPGQAG